MIYIAVLSNREITAEPLLQYSPCSLDPCMAATYRRISMKTLTRYQIILLGEQRHIGVNNLPNVVARQCISRESNPRPFERKSNALTTTPPSHQCHDGVFVLCMCVCVSWKWQRVQRTNRLCGCQQLTVPYTTGSVLLTLLLFFSCSLLTCSGIAGNIIHDVRMWMWQANSFRTRHVTRVENGAIYFFCGFRDMASLAKSD